MKKRKTKIYWLPIILIWRDRTIKTDGMTQIISPAIYIRKGRTLTVEGYDNTGSEPLLFATLLPALFKCHGNIRILRTAMTPDLIKDLFNK